MSDLVAVRGNEPWRRRLLLPTYTIADAARYVGESPQLIASWHYRETQTGVVLPGKEHGKPLSYMQLIEVVVVSTFRKLGVSLQRVRKARQYLAQRFNVEFPFTEYRFKTEGFHILLDLQQFENDEELRLVVADRGGQLAWETIMENRLLEFDYEDDGIAVKWHPAGRQSLVVINPRVAFGAPNVSGIPTWILKGRYNAGETIADIMEDFNLEEAAIKDAWKFEGIDITKLALV
jgi:uncharacterized protein (DUF433 family)